MNKCAFLFALYFKSVYSGQCFCFLFCFGMHQTQNYKDTYICPQDTMRMALGHGIHGQFTSSSVNMQNKKKDLGFYPPNSMP